MEGLAVAASSTGGHSILEIGSWIAQIVLGTLAYPHSLVWPLANCERLGKTERPIHCWMSAATGRSIEGDFSF